MICADTLIVDQHHPFNTSLADIIPYTILAISDVAGQTAAIDVVIAFNTSLTYCFIRTSWASLHNATSWAAE